MIDIIKRVLVTVVSGAVIIYTGTLIASQVIVVQPEYTGMNLVSILMIIALAIYMMVVYGIYPLYHPMQKRTLAVLGLAAILFGQGVLLNDYNTSIYAGDIMKIFGAMIVWFGATGILTNDPTIKGQKKGKMIEIIEA